MAKKKRERRKTQARRITGGGYGKQSQRAPARSTRPRRKRQPEYIAVPMAFLVGAPSGTHRTAMALQQPLSLETSQAILDILAGGVEDVVSAADRLVSVSQYFEDDVPATHARIFIEQLDAGDADEDVPCLIELEVGEMVDTGMVADDGVVVIQALWVLSVLIVTEKSRPHQGGPDLYFLEIPEPTRLELQRLLEEDIQVEDIEVYPSLCHESALPEMWREFVETLLEASAEAGKTATLGEREGRSLAEAEERSRFGRFFPILPASAEQALDLLVDTARVNVSFYPYPDFIAVHGYRDDETGEHAYGEYLGTRALHLAQLRAAARKRGRDDIEFVDSTVTADALFAWLEQEGLENTPTNRAKFVGHAKETP
jgi:hypothetical protein